MPDGPFDLVLRNARGDDGQRMDIAIGDGRIAHIGASGSTDGKSEIDAAGGLVLPSLVDGHIHLDKTLWGLPLVSHVPGATVQQRVVAEKVTRRQHRDGAVDRARRLIEHLVTMGTGWLRCHVDIDEEVGISNLEGLLALREQMRDVIDIQFAAFPQSGIVASAGVADLMVDAMNAGAEVVGGLDPAGFDGDIEGHLDIVFGLAERFDRHIDIHLHDAGELGAYELRRIAERTIAAGMQGRVAVSHAFALGEVAAPVLAMTSALLARAEVAIMTNGPGPDSMPPIRSLTADGVCVFAGSDNIRDAWSPYGNGDMLERARLIGYRAGLATDEDLRCAFDLASCNARQVIGAEPVTLAAGCPADLMVLAAEHTPDAVVSNPRRRFVLKAGRLVARDGVLVDL